MTVFLDSRLPGGTLSPLRLKRRLGTVLKALGRGGASLSVLIAGDAELRELNLGFRGKDAPTNVLAFPFRPGQGPEACGAEAGPKGAEGAMPFPEHALPKAMQGYLGDLAVSFETVARQAGEQGIPEGELLYFYLIHGLLHLLGYDHERSPGDDEAQTRETHRLMGLIPHTLP
ncbi:MAG: rRNA maturation RNase YbeY [Deltaproteobacteria bacterium]|nr:rRNA maturation RNase YbeY [Deltaproteobacteria bacterium]